MPTVKELAKEQRPNFVWWILFTVGNATVSTATVTAWLRYFKDIPLDVKFIVLLFAVSLICFGFLLWFGRRRAFSSIASNGPDVPTASCPDTWLHELAETQRRDIARWVIADVRYGRFDLLRQQHPYIEFWLSLKNTSVFSVSLTGLGGSIKFANEPVSGTLEWGDAPIKNLRPGDRNDCIVRLTISDPADVARILNIRGSFGFQRVKARIEAVPGNIEAQDLNLNLHGSRSNDELLAVYKKIKPDIQKVELKGYYDFTVQDWMEQCLGSVINIKMHFENPRQTRIDVASFKLDTSPQIERITVAQNGEIYEGLNRLDVGITAQGKELNNLASKLPIAAEYKAPYEGWLQFVIRGVGPTYLKASTPTLVILAQSGEEHRWGCPALEYEP